jgi:hypothetical protein
MDKKKPLCMAQGHKTQSCACTSAGGIAIERFRVPAVCGTGSFRATGTLTFFPPKVKPFLKLLKDLRIKKTRTSEDILVFTRKQGINRG